MNQKIQSIIFDADGMVVNGEMFSLQYQKDFGINNDQMLPFFTGAFQKCLIGQADTKTEITPYLKQWKWKGTADELLEYWHKAEHKIDQRLVDLITKLRARNIKCVLGTNQDKYRAEYMNKHMEFGRIFDHIFSSAELGCKKPESQFYQKITNFLKEKYNISQTDIMYWDDEPGYITLARKFGLNSHLYQNFYDFEEKINTIL